MGKTKKAEKPTGRMLRPKEVAEELGISRATVTRMIQDGDLPCVRVRTLPRVPRVELERYIARRQQVAK